MPKTPAKKRTGPKAPRGLSRSLNFAITPEFEAELTRAVEKSQLSWSQYLRLAVEKQVAADLGK